MQPRLPTYQTLISVDEVRQLPEANLVMLDCRFRLDNASYGYDAYRFGHLPGAHYVHLEQHLCGTQNGSNGRHPLPNPDKLANFFGELGVHADAQVVVYDDDIGIYAARAWWLLRWLGHSKVAVLDGGLAAWTMQRCPVTNTLSSPSARQFTRQSPLTDIVDADAILANLTHPTFVVVDARSPERFLGQADGLDSVKGHIPGAVNRFFRDNNSTEGYFKPIPVLQKEWQAILGQHTPLATVHQCGSGITACHNLLALEHAGGTGGRLYPGSWSEWSSHPTYPITVSATS